MALRACYIGDPLTARGMALAGLRAETPAPDTGEVWTTLEKARAEADLVLIEESLARLVAVRLERLLGRDPLPPVLRIDGLDRAGEGVRRSVDEARRELGVA